MSDPRQAKVWGKKSEIADRTLNERKYCKLCDYYYSEMFTCPICFGADRERERIINLLEEWGEEAGCFCCASDVAASEIIELIKGEQK